MFAGYVRVSTGGQGDSGLGLDAQESAIRQCAEQRGLVLGGIVSEVVSGAATKRPLWDELVNRCRRGELQGIVVAKLDRAGRSAISLLRVAEDAKLHGYRVVVADKGLTIPGQSANDRAFLTMLALFAEWERDTISDRTKEALAAAKAQGKVLGRPRAVGDDTAALVASWRSSGVGFSEISRRLDEQGVRTRDGGLWRPSSVRALYERYERESKS